MKHYYLDLSNTCIVKSAFDIEKTDLFIELPAEMASYFSHKMNGNTKIEIPENAKNLILEMIEQKRELDKKVSQLKETFSKKKREINADYEKAVKPYFDNLQKQIQVFEDVKNQRFSEVAELEKIQIEKLQNQQITKASIKKELDSLYDEFEKELFTEFRQVVKLEKVSYKGKIIDCYALYEYKKNVQNPQLYYLWYSESGLKVMREEGKRFSKITEKRKSSFLNFEAIEKNRTEEREKAESLKAIIRQVAENSGFSFEDVQKIIKIA